MGNFKGKVKVEQLLLTLTQPTNTCLDSEWKTPRQPPEVFYKKRVLKNFAKFTEKSLATLQKQETQVFSCQFCEIFITLFFTKHLPATASENTKLISRMLCWLFSKLTIKIPKRQVFLFLTFKILNSTFGILTYCFYL